MPYLTCRPEIAALVPEALAREAGVFPLDFSDDVFTFAAGGPLPDDIEEKLRFVLGREIQVVIHPEEAIRQALDDCYGVGNEVEVSLFYFRECARILDSGAIEISVSGWESGQGRIGHWTGWESFAPDNPDYPLWTWILAQGERFPKIIGPTELEAIREAFRGARSRPSLIGPPRRRAWGASLEPQGGSMRLVTEDDLASIDAPDPEGDGIDACLLADPELGPVLRVYLVLTRRPSLFIRSGWSPESIVWSLYYWFRRLVALRAASSGFDAGLEQQAFQILEAPHPACELDWSELESIEALAVEHAMTQRRRRPGADDDPFAGK